MNRVWTKDPPKYECLTCHRICYATNDGYMPVHRKKDTRKRCSGSGSSVRFHKKVS